MRASSNLFYQLKCCCDFDFEKGSALEGLEDSIPWQEFKDARRYVFSLFKGDHAVVS